MFVGQRELRLVIVVTPGPDVVVERVVVVEEALAVPFEEDAWEEDAWGEDAWPVGRTPALPPLDGEEGGTPIVTVTAGAVVIVVDVEIEMQPVL